MVLGVGVGQAGAAGGRETLAAGRVGLARKDRARRRGQVVDLEPRPAERARADHAVELGPLRADVGAQALQVWLVVGDDGDRDLPGHLQVGGAVLGLLGLARIGVARLRARHRLDR